MLLLSNCCFIGIIGFKVGLEERPIAMAKEDGILWRKRAATMLVNNIAMSRFFSERVCKKYDLMYSQRAYVHWFVAEGMEEGEFAEARENLGFLEKDYLDLVSEQATDEMDDESD